MAILTGCMSRALLRRAERWWRRTRPVFVALVWTLRLGASGAFLPSERPPCATRSSWTYKPEAYLDSPEGFFLARTVCLRWRCSQKKGSELCEEAGCAGQSPRGGPCPQLLVPVRSRGPRCSRPGVRARDLSTTHADPRSAGGALALGAEWTGEKGVGAPDLLTWITWCLSTGFRRPTTSSPSSTDCLSTSQRLSHLEVKPEVSAEVERGQEKGLEREADQGLFLLTHDAHQKLCGIVEDMSLTLLSGLGCDHATSGELRALDSIEEYYLGKYRNF
ncbi:uncharacterized protein LOC128121510 [Peromyscus californicus insignis]|uniref:uncharacterized protein LOC128121510 n=1 Tax=Peromyscus californicus insignis TaxID=564181 RepID=UPI0022A6E870|nr:uncharacterized protein LOC128121510 [Peromyscus californicus insignis]